LPCILGSWNSSLPPCSSPAHCHISHYRRLLLPSGIILALSLRVGLKSHFLRTRLSTTSLATSSNQLYQVSFYPSIYPYILAFLPLPLQFITISHILRLYDTSTHLPRCYSDPLLGDACIFFFVPGHMLAPFPCHFREYSYKFGSARRFTSIKQLLHLLRPTPVPSHLVSLLRLSLL
jgi:hypothetical protein